jgi:SEC-C motif-containing protein
MKARDCPCYSGLSYNACCGVLHKNGGAATTPEALMRSRYAAFALGLGAYLVDTLASTHSDRELPREQLAAVLAGARETQRYMGLEILHTRMNGDHGEVLFIARVFERGVDRSFAEASTFRRENGSFRYASGTMVPLADLTNTEAIAHAVRDAYG